MTTGTDADKALKPFGSRSGSLLERAIFGHRWLVLLVCAAITAVLGYQASKLELGASFEKMIPQGHPYIQNFNAHRNDLMGLGDVIRIAVENPDGTIYDADYLATLRKISDEVFLMPGVNRGQMQSLWTPNTRWTGVTEYGLEGGPVIPDGYDGSQKSLDQLAANIARSGEVGQIVAEDYRSSIVFVPLLSETADGQKLDYAALGKRLEALRSEYQSQGVKVHITGFAKLVSDLIDGVSAVMAFFAVTLVTAAVFILWFTRCWRSTLLVVSVSVVAVVWLLGVLPTLGYVLDPYSILVPFLVFAIGLSHGSQKMNGIMQDVGRGWNRQAAARLTFRRLFLVGVTALLSDAVGFAVLLVIDIGAIQQLALAASLGVGLLIVTNLILLPVLLSYIGVSPKAARRSLQAEQADEAGAARHPVWRALDLFTTRRWAQGAIGAAVLLAIGAALLSTQLKIGDLDPGAPELRKNSVYNQDVAFINQAYGASSDVMAIMVETPQGYCSAYDTLNKVDALEWRLRQLDGVEGTNTLALLNRRMLSGLNEGNPKWYEFNRNQQMLNLVTSSAPRGLYNDACSLLTLYVYLSDHEAETLSRVVDTVEGFAAVNDTDDVKFKLAAGTAGIEAATNIVVSDAWSKMMLLVYSAVFVLCLLTFRSWRAVLVAMLPLFLVSLLAEALMVLLGIGVKVATLPVIALGAGIGVDYALYILSVTLAQLREGRSLSEAYYRALLLSGKVVMLIGVTLAIGVVTWTFSPIKFQADMGLMLAFMFIGNMLAALILLPALAHFLLKSQVPATASRLQPDENAGSPESAEYRAGTANERSCVSAQ
ncbi:efflux RND transporter permease subunit [Marinobacter bohaiensis]|uniref:efflux RND transporter permease subunit n=1 Tax=Marinobacter bohaiensis TaxID=2201898 RepID=UPI000DAF167A|nr:MMPL family transporter [Marinobacter bohaiensis]